jgi:hypothetical protein
VLYPDDTKVFFPNLELRLPEAVNKDGSSINIHLLFRPDLPKTTADKFLNTLETELTGASRVKVTCSELSGEQFASATVTRQNIEDSIRKTFGRGATSTDHVIVVTSANGDGIRPGGAGSKKRKNSLVDEIDKESDAFFGNPGSTAHFLDVDRLETNEKVAPKPVFAGCDAHSFNDIDQRLGKHVATRGNEQHITWIKADLTFEGLQQTLIEPDARVKLTPGEPDQKEPYKYISKVHFAGSTDFPAEIVLNRNLNSIIGSRSSGKSALLAFIAHAVDAAGTLERQRAAAPNSKVALGPAAGKSWEDVAHITCSVEWGSTDASAGKVIYIPQNSLYSISEQPILITEKIAPALFRSNKDLATSITSSSTDVDANNEAIAVAVRAWLKAQELVKALREATSEIGDKAGISSVRNAIQSQIDDLKTTTELSDDDISQYQVIVATLGTIAERLDVIETEKLTLDRFVDSQNATYVAKPGQITVHIATKPELSALPSELAATIQQEFRSYERAITADVESRVLAYRLALEKEQVLLTADAIEIETTNAELIEKNKANVELEALIERHNKETAALTHIAENEKLLEAYASSQNDLIGTIVASTEDRQASLKSIESAFAKEDRVLEDLSFGIELGFDPESIVKMSVAFQKNRSGDYVLAAEQLVDHAKAQSDPADFLAQLDSGKQKLNQGASVGNTAVEVLCATPEIRFSATLDGDSIGGFGKSSMTPGKQALFALTLTLNESQEPWPLLIDQPEDDLDSRSIYDVVVPYIAKRKSERQIIMVSHNANLVIGADSEEVIIANRHGEDRKNENGHMFSYFTGSLEHSAKDLKQKTVLRTLGIREHACQILDGGEEAFQKRRNKYKI